MKRKLLSLSFLLVLWAAGTALALSPAEPAQAQAETPAPDSRCRTCHESLYFLHDSGQWCCFCERERTCTCCHGGNPDTANVELAHEGMVANPITENPAICQDCHPDDYQDRIERFSKAAGIEPTPLGAPTRTPQASAWAGSTGDRPTSPLLEPQPLAPWQVAALGLLGGAFLATIMFGYRCWKADCLANIIHTQEKLS
jgi:hypothetical protein